MSAPRATFSSDSTDMLKALLQQLQPPSKQHKKFGFFRKDSQEEVKSSHQEKILATATKIDSLIKNIIFNTTLDEQLREIRSLIKSIKDKKEDGVANKFLMVADRCVDEIVNCSGTLSKIESLHNNIKKYLTDSTSELEDEIKAEINSWVKCFHTTEDSVTKINIYPGLLTLGDYINSHKTLSKKFSDTMQAVLNSLSGPHSTLGLHMKYEKRMNEIDEIEGAFVKEEDMKQIASTSQAVIGKLDNDIKRVGITIKAEYNHVVTTENAFLSVDDEKLEIAADLKKNLNNYSRALEKADADMYLLQHIKNSLLYYHNDLFAKAYDGKYSVLVSYMEHTRSLEKFADIHEYEFATWLKSLMYDLLDLVTDDIITSAYIKFRKSTIGSYIDEFKSLDTRTAGLHEREKLKTKLNEILEDKNISQADKDKLIKFKSSFRGASKLEILTMMLPDSDFLKLRQKIESFAGKYPKKTAKVASFIKISETLTPKVNPKKAEAAKQAKEVKVEPRKFKAFDKSIVETPTHYRFPDPGQDVKPEDKQSSKKRI